MVAKTVRSRDSPAIRRNVRSENVLSENADSRSSFASMEKNRLSSENPTMPIVRATVSVCACCAQLTRLSVQTAITRPAETSQMRKARLAVGDVEDAGAEEDDDEAEHAAHLEPDVPGEVVVQPPAELHRFGDRGEVVVTNDHDRRALGHLGPGL